ncbi:hypothetical protein GCM10023322_28240 [Rugosimonospora acidiphila]|uniref:Uncharacterized protein n=1 Tax=Rugosimonospora acidiphila TaxID=556531 RepID=A0ABP9RSL4_9ACTN
MGNPPTDNWHPVDKAPIKVDVSGLQDFAKLVHDELTNDFTVNFQQGVQPMLQAIAPFGDGGLQEGKFFREQHQDCVEAIGGLLQDIGMGMDSLSSAATSIYIEYLSGDELSSATLDDVLTAFFPTPGMMTLQQKLDQGDKDGGSDSSDGKTTDVPPKIPQLDPNAPAPHYDPGAGQTIAPGTPGAYTIPADSDHMNQTPTDPLQR